MERDSRKEEEEVVVVVVLVMVGKRSSVLQARWRGEEELRSLFVVMRRRGETGGAAQCRAEQSRADSDVGVQVQRAAAAAARQQKRG